MRTIGMDAWDAVSHHPVHKNDLSIPDELKRDYYALSALFHVADTQFEHLRKAALQSGRKAASLFQSGSALDIPVNSDTLRACLGERFPDTRPCSPNLASAFVAVLVGEIGYKTVADVARVVGLTNDARPALERIMPAKMPRQIRGTLNFGGRLAAALLLGERKYLDRDRYWEPLAEDVKRIASEYGLKTFSDEPDRPTEGGNLT